MVRRDIPFLSGLPPVSINVMTVTRIGCHWHDSLEVVWVLSGEIRLQESHMLCHLKQGDVYVVNYNDTHRISADNGPAVVAFVHIDYRYFSKYIPNLREISFSHYCFSKNVDLEDSLKNCHQFIAELYRLICQATTGKDLPMKIETLTHSFLLLLIDIFQYIYYENDDGEYRDAIDKSLNLSQKQLRRLHRLTYYIYTHCNDKLTLDDVAKSEYYSKFYVSHFIKKAYGLSYQETVSLSRVGISERLLLATDYNMDAIAQMVGFSTRNQYCSQFKKWHGIAPSQYRKENSPENPNNRDLLFHCDEALIDKHFFSVWS